MKKTLLGTGLLFGMVILFIVARTISFIPNNHPKIAPVDISVDANRISEHLAQAIQFRTVSRQPPLPIDYEPFLEFINWVDKTYPEVNSVLERRRFGNYSLLYTWVGKNSDLPPILLTAHYDVVPVPQNTELRWLHPPFSGDIKDGEIWGRGALDDKGAVVAMLEAVTLLVRQGFQPQQTVYFSFGHDEEIGGSNGAAKVTAYLGNKNIKLAWTLDEGSFIFDGDMFGVKPQVALINVAEKGYLTVELIASSKGGHSSMPPQSTAVSILAQALIKLQQSPVPGGLDGLSSEMFDTVAKYMPFTRRVLFANQWLFAPIIEYNMSSKPFSNAMLRTTTAPTMLSASTKENVLPSTATAVVNFRLHPRDTIASITHYIRNIVANENIEVRVRKKITAEASPVADAKGPGFIDIARSTREIYGDDIVFAPGLMVAASDSRYYGTIAANAYRFTPMILKKDDIALFHGINERLSVENLVRATKTYVRLIENATGPRD